MKNNTSTRKQDALLLLSDAPSYGTVALKMSEAVLRRMHYEVFSLPTALISNTLNFGKTEILDTTAYLFRSLSVWKELGFDYSALFLGFVNGLAQAEQLYQLAKEEKEKGKYIFFDPIMADRGRLYHGLTEEDVLSRKKLMAVSDCIFPNKTEACLLAGRKTVPEDFRPEEAKDLVKSLANAGAKDICITSMRIQGESCIFLYEEKTQSFYTIPYKERNLSLGGTGDLFSSLFIGKYLEEEALLPAGKWAIENIGRILDAFLSENSKEKTIPIELYLQLIS